MTILTVLLFLLIVALCALYPYRKAFYSPKTGRTQIDDPITGSQHRIFSDDILHMSHIMHDIPCENVAIESFDGLILAGRYYHVADDAPVEILFHGYRSHPFRDCSGGHALARKMGFNTLVVDQRAHGDSEGTTITFGILERFDCLAWARYASDRFGSRTPLILSGLSMGAATVLMASELDLPGSVACILADCPYSSPAAILEKVCETRRYPLFLCRPFLYLGAFLYGHFRLGSCTAKEAVRHAKVPILLIHGEADRLVPCDMSREIAEECASRVEVYTFPEAGHGLSYLIDPVRYEKIVYGFLRSIPALQGKIRDDFVQQWQQ